MQNDVRNLLTADCDVEYLRRQAARLEAAELLEEIETGEAKNG